MYPRSSSASASSCGGAGGGVGGGAGAGQRQAAGGSTPRAGGSGWRQLGLTASSSSRQPWWRAPPRPTPAPAAAAAAGRRQARAQAAAQAVAGGLPCAGLLPAKGQYVGGFQNSAPDVIINCMEHAVLALLAVEVFVAVVGWEQAVPGLASFAPDAKEILMAVVVLGDVCAWSFGSGLGGRSPGLCGSTFGCAPFSGGCLLGCKLMWVGHSLVRAVRRALGGGSGWMC